MMVAGGVGGTGGGGKQPPGGGDKKPRVQPSGRMDIITALVAVIVVYIKRGCFSAMPGKQQGKKNNWVNTAMDRNTLSPDGFNARSLLEALVDEKHGHVKPFQEFVRLMKAELHLILDSMQQTDDDDDEYNPAWDEPGPGF